MENNFSKNLKIIRENKKISQQEIADKIGVDRSAISYWESGKAEPTMGNVVKVAEVLDVDIISLIGGNFNFDNAELLETKPIDTVKIPVLGVIKAGIPIEAQEEIIDYVDIPKEWTKGDKKFYALKISGDSMYPKYQTNDIVVFELTHDIDTINKKDCVVMVNGYDATFKNVIISESGITLVPLNLNNSDGFQPTFYDPEQINGLPVKIIGVAKRKISDV